MESLSKVLVSLREKNVKSPEVILLPMAMSKKDEMPKRSFHFYMKMAHNIICL